MAFYQHVDGIKRSSRRNEERFAVRPAEAQVGGRFGHRDGSQQLAVRAENFHAVAGTRPHPAIGIATDAIGHAWIDSAKHAAVRERAVGHHI